MRRIAKGWILVAALLLFVPSLVQAGAVGTVEWVFPNDKAGPNNVPAGVANKTIDLKVNITEPSFPNIEATISPVNGARTGELVAGDAMIALCNAAFSAGYRCKDGLGVFFLVGGCAAPPNPFECVIRQDVGGGCQGDKGVKFTSSGTKVTAEPTGFGPCVTKMKAGLTSTSAENTIVTDHLSRFCIRVDRGNPAVDGNVNFSVRYFRPDIAQGPQQALFSVNTTGKDDATVHQDIVNGFTSLGLGLEIGAMDLPGTKCEFDAAFNGPLASIWNVPGRGILSIGASGLQGQTIIVETNGPGLTGQIPTLSEWGLIVLVALLSLSALWMLRRRRQVGSPV